MGLLILRRFCSRRPGLQRYGRIASWTSLLMIAVVCSVPLLPPREAPSPAVSLPVIQSAVGADQQVGPGILTLSNLVTVVPYEVQTERGEPRRIYFPAEVDGWHARFELDLGVDHLYLDRTYLQPNPTGGIDTVTAANKVPEKVQRNVYDGDTVHATVRLGSLVADFVDPLLGTRHSHHGNAVLNHVWSGSDGFGSRLGNISFTVLEPYETILDFPHHHIILIRLDPTGHRLAVVSAYTPYRVIPLFKVGRIDLPSTDTTAVFEWGVQAILSGVLDTLLIDTGNEPDELDYITIPKIAAHLTIHGDSRQGHAALDHLVFAGRTYNAVPFELEGKDSGLMQDWIGLPFLSRLGVVGFNFRTRQLILYR